MHKAGSSGVARQSFVLCGRARGVYRMAYREWGEPDNPQVVLCAHGLTRNSRDFERLAAALAPEFRVVAPDVPGRGQSDWLSDPQDYNLHYHLQDMLVLIARLNVTQLGWVGTSMGGLIGMALAGLPGSPINRLLINDVGPVLIPAAVMRIAQYVGNAPADMDYDTACAFVRMASASFGPHNEADWAFLTEVMLKADAQGHWGLNYDPAIAKMVRAAISGVPIDLWSSYDHIQCPTLLLRGADSDLLTPETVAQMCQRGPKPVCVEFPGVGHAPTLLQPEQIAVVRDFFCVQPSTTVSVPVPSCG